jgi:hypothetical protein
MPQAIAMRKTASHNCLQSRSSPDVCMNLLQSANPCSALAMVAYTCVCAALWPQGRHVHRVECDTAYSGCRQAGIPLEQLLQ